MALRALEGRLRERSPSAPASARFGAVTFIQRFGSALNAHLHFHICVIDGVFSQDPAGALRFHRATGLEVTDFADAVRGFYRPIKKQVTLRLDVDLLAWFRSLEGRYQTRINAERREYMESQRKIG